ncbi:tyrosine-type recombinase/integrase [Spirillospora sp. NPDC048911]|uniref:tyrosine-type recombinase/integrase n=1 Tax=Spirillospora sp. NPDC048911 TaxID=3364527 RepID=UPI0037102726
MDTRHCRVLDGDVGLWVPRVQRLRSFDGGPVSYTVLDSGDLPIWPVEDYLSHLASQRRSPNTIRGYAHDLADFFEWLERLERDFRSLTLEQLSEFFEWLRRPAAAREPGVFALPSVESVVEGSTLVRKRAAVAGFYRFHSRRDPRVPALLGDPVGRRPTGSYVPLLAHTRRGRLDQDGFSPIRIKPVRKTPTSLTDEEIARLLKACRRARERFWIILLNETGLRLGEALGLRHSDLRLRAGEVHVVPREANVNEVRVKGLKARIVPVGNIVLDAYADYMETEYGALDCDYVFVNLFRGPHGAPMTPESIKDHSRRLRRDSGVHSYTPHALRHSFATRLLRAKVPMEIVAELLGHSDAQTTHSTYSHLSVEDHRRALVDAGVLDAAADVES